VYALSEYTQVSPGSESVASVRGITHVPGRSDKLRKERAVDASKVLQTERATKVCQKSDCLIVAMKLVKANGAKGATNQRIALTKHA